MPTLSWVSRLFMGVAIVCGAGCAPAQPEFVPVPERVAFQDEINENARTIIVNDVAIPVTVEYRNIDPRVEHEIKVIDGRDNLVAMIDSYASRPQGMSLLPSRQRTLFSTDR